MLKNLVIAVLACALAVSLVFHFTGREGEIPEAGHASAAVTENAVAEPSGGEPGEPVPDLQPEPAPAPDPLVAALSILLDETAKDPAFEGAAIGFCLVGPDGAVLLDRAAKTAQIPASSLKTLTTATALEVLGPEFRFQTRLGVSEANADDPTKPVADLILLGGGDPKLGFGDLETWATGLAEAGVQSIPGRVIGDGRLFGSAPFADFWNWGDIGNGYGSPVSGLNLGHNRFSALFAPGEKAGDPAELLGTLPEVPGVNWWNEVVTGEEGSGDGVAIYGGERASVLHLRGTVPPGDEFEVTGAVPDPERFAAHHLRLALLAANIIVAGEAQGAGDLFLKGETVPTIAKELLVHQSPSLLEIVTSIHETSDNQETECVYRMIGLQSGLPSDEAIRRHWRQRGLELSGLRLVDGSGLARADHITPESLALLQHFAATGAAGDAYRNSLLEAGDGKLRFKAGAMSSIRSYAGLVERESGWHSFALMLNHYADGGAVNRLQRSFFEILLQDGSAEEGAEPEP